MNLIRIGGIVINFDLVAAVIEGEAAGSDPGSLIVQFNNDRRHTFSGDDARTLRGYLGRTAKDAALPPKDHGFK